MQSTDYSVLPDGRVEVKVGGMPRGCSVYLFDRIPIRRVPSPAKAKVIWIIKGTAPVQSLSIHDLASLPRDGEGVSEVSISPIRPKPRPARSN